MNAKTPIEINGELYPFYSINLAISTIYQNGKEEGTAAMRLIPTKIEVNGIATTQEDFARPVLLGSTNNLQEPEKSAVEAIYTALQNYIIAKNL